MKVQFVINKSRRSLISCTECRRKKQKCDEMKPSCSRCLANNADCHYTKVTKPPLGTRGKHRHIAGTHVFSAFNGSNGEVIERVGDASAGSIIEFLHNPEYKATNQNKIYELTDDTEVDHQEDQTNFLEHNLSVLDIPALELDLEFQALTIISSSDYMRNYFHKYNQCYSLILPLAYANKTVMFTFAGWLLSINHLSDGEKFLRESSKLFDTTEANLVRNHNSPPDDFTGALVSQTCQALLAASRGDYLLWRKKFEKIYKLLKQLGIDEAISLSHENPFACWALGWFFYQDIFKLGRMSKRDVFGPLFPKTSYMKVIEEAYHNSENSNVPSACGPMTKCCIELYVTMGEINTLYDLFTVKRQELQRFCGTFISPIIENKSISEQDLMYFLDSDIYRKYDRMKKHFHKWFTTKENILEAKLCQCVPNENIPNVSDEQKAKLVIFHDILKDSPFEYS